MKKTLLLPVLLGMVSIPCSAQSLDSALQSALEFSPDYQAQIRAYEKTLELRTIANGALMPAVSLKAGSTDKTDKRNNGAKTKTDQNSQELTISQSLYRGGAIWYGRSQSEIKIKQAHAVLQSQKQALMIQVVQAYTDVLLARQTLKLRESALKIAQTALTIASENAESGIKSGDDVLIAQSQFATAQANLISAQGQVDIAENAYFAITGQGAGANMDTLPTLVNSLPALSWGNLDSAIASAHKTAPNMVAKRLGVQVADYQVKIKQATLRPSVTATYSHTTTRTTPQNQATTRNTNTALSVQAKIPLYQQGVARSQLQQARLDARRANNMLDSTRIMTDRTIKRHWHNRTVFAKTATAHKLAWESGKKRLKSAKTEVQNGTRPTTDLNTLESEMIKSKIAYLTALRDKVMAHYKLRQSVGDLGGDLGADINSHTTQK